ncbi:hypothetical protein AMATHDRAFT_147837 [Amanita thiersii Skay4041]|uniref:DASH complex subunit DAM1 n=1 Tax=Amanita thiersii Skay4041 TaxID=703135 RepID=A0A2A9NNK2_9AGAR|nr:hypothetical protein AMATHDRAFT_147837 [Amanita thiersii Skay4041]
MLPSQTPHRTPLKRVSQGSLFALSRSGAYPDAPHGLGFIEPAMAEFVDETEALQANVEGLKNLSDSLATFNESFASWLYVMNMNALTVDWFQAPTETSFVLAKRRAEQEAARAMEALKAAKAKQPPPPPDPDPNMGDQTVYTEYTEGETTYMANTTANITALAQGAGGSGVVKKKKGKGKLSAKEKKDRRIQVENIIKCLPLEFRESDPALRRDMESVIEGILDAPDQTVKLMDLIKPPFLNQARVNKCLIALVNRKAVKKDNSSGTVLYIWKGLF